jgi:hypothetical protein
MAAAKTKPRGPKHAKAFLDQLRISVMERTGTRDPKSKRKLRVIADKLVERAMGGETMAIKEVADRLDGKPVQATNNTHKIDTSLEDAMRQIDGTTKGIRHHVNRK